MSDEALIALKERLNELKARQRKLSLEEERLALRIQAIIQLESETQIRIMGIEKMIEQNKATPRPWAHNCFVRTNQR